MYYSDFTVVSNNSFSDNRYSGIDLRSSDRSLLENNVLNNNKVGILLDYSHDTGIFGNTISGNNCGISTIDDCPDTSVHGNDILDNSPYGIDSLFGIDATMNWWGDNSGPYELYDNPGGKGNEVSRFNEYDPWTGKDQINQLPYIILDKPAKGATLKGSYTVKGWAQDTDNPVQKVEVRVDSGDWQEAEGTMGWTFALNTTLYPNGAHTVSARASDGTDHSPTVTVSVTVNNALEDILRPDFLIIQDNISHTGPGEKGKAENITVVVSNVGDASGAVDVCVYLDSISNDTLLHNETLEVMNGSSASVEFKWTPTGNGSFQLMVLLTDNSTVPENNTDNNQATRSVTIGVEGDPGNGDGDKPEDDGGDSPLDILLEEQGPLPVPLIGYIVIGLVLIIVIVMVAKRKGSSSGEEEGKKGAMDPASQAGFPSQQTDFQMPPLGPMAPPAPPSPQFPQPQPAFPAQQVQAPAVPGFPQPGPPQPVLQQQPGPLPQFQAPAPPTAPPTAPAVVPPGPGTQGFGGMELPGLQGPAAPAAPVAPTQAPQPAPQPAQPRNIPSQVRCPQCKAVINVNPDNTTPTGKVRIVCLKCGAKGSI